MFGHQQREHDMTAEITEEIARKVLTIVDAGLVHGVGNPIPGQMCVEAAVCYALGLPHGDDPQCVAESLRVLKIRLNDSSWSSNLARAKGLRRLAVAQLGSAGILNEAEFTRLIIDNALGSTVPRALRIAASVQRDPKHKAALIEAASRCERERSRKAASDALATASAANAAAACAAAACAACAADADANAAAAYAAAACANANANANADAAANAAAYAANAANAAANAHADAARDQSLATYAEEVVQILVEMRAPGCQWLTLTEIETA
jgi:aminopeptidase N